MIKDVIYYSDNNHNKIVFLKGMDGKGFCLSIRSSLTGGNYKNDNSKSGNAVVRTDVSEINKLKELESKLHEEIKLRNQFGQFYIITIIIFFIIACIPNTSSYTPDNQIASTWGWLILFVLPIFGFVKKLGMSPAGYRITLKNLKRNIIEGSLFSFFLCSIMFFFRYLTIAPDEPFICWKSFSSFSNFQFYLYIGTYWVHCYIQEFIIRGVFQGLIQKFFKDSHFLLPILLISFIFCAVHIQKSYHFAVLTFIVSIIFGCIYYRHRNLIGVSIVHYITGILAIAFGYF